MIVLYCVYSAVTITLYDLGEGSILADYLADYQEDSRSLLYEDRLIMDYPISQGIRIPLEDMKRRADPSESIYGDYLLSLVEAQVTVTTPNQSEFSDTKTHHIELWP